MRKAFTLIELLVIIGIMAAMVTMSVVSVRSGQEASRLRGATRDILAKIRHARSVALVSQQSVVVEYSNVPVDDENAAQIKVVGAKLLSTSAIKGEVETLSGEKLKLYEGDDENAEGEKGESVEDVLFSDVSSDVVRGVLIKVVMADEEVFETKTAAQKKSGISAWGTNIGYIRSKYEEEKTKESESKEETSVDLETKEVVWEANGRTSAHTVYIYREGSDFSTGFKLKIDRFGAIKVISQGEDE